MTFVPKNRQLIRIIHHYRLFMAHKEKRKNTNDKEKLTQKNIVCK